jgi:hypothetical protein
MSEQRHEDAVSIAEGIARQLVDARAEETALSESLAEVREHIAELEAQRDELRQRIEASAPLSAERVRDVIRRLSVFTFSELVAELGASPADVRRLFKPMQLGGWVREAGHVGRKPVFEFVKPDTSSGPSSHPTKRPPEKEPPAMTESRATGLPVRVAAAEKITRRGRSTPGVAQKVKNRDRNYARQEAARAERAEAARSKAQKDPKWKRKSKR